MPSLFLMRSDKTTKQSYKSAFISAVIQAAGGEVKTIMASQDSEQHHSDRWYRDAVFVIPNNKIILTTAQADASRKTTQKNIIDEILSRDSDFRIIDLDAYFEGGNVFYLPAHNVLLHGDHAQGHYIPHFKPREQTKKISTQLASAGISVLGLELSQEALDANVPPYLDRGYFHAYYAYHLDCFMQTIPDGRVLLINAKILSPESLAKLKALLGDQLIDLAYENYLTEPFLLNFLTVPFEDSFRIISNRLPDEIVNKLQELGYSVITPQMFLPVLSTFHEGFNQSVIQNIRKSGYLADFSDTSILVDPTLDDPFRDISILMGMETTDNIFNPGGSGGLHCLVLDIPNLGKGNLMDINRDNLLITSATGDNIAPSDWKMIIEDTILDPLERAYTYGMLLSFCANKHQQLILLNYFFNQALQLGRMPLYNHPLSMENINDLKRFIPRLAQEIDQFIEEHLQEIFFQTHNPSQYQFPIFQTLPLQSLLNNAICPQDLKKIDLYFRLNLARELGILPTVSTKKLSRLKDNEIFQGLVYISKNVAQFIHNEEDRRDFIQLFPSLRQHARDVELKDSAAGVDLRHKSPITPEKAKLLIEKALELYPNNKPIAHLKYAKTLPTVATLLKHHGILHENSPENASELDERHNKKL